MRSVKTNVETFERSSAARGGQVYQSTNQSCCALIIAEAMRR